MVLSVIVFSCFLWSAAAQLPTLSGEPLWHASAHATRYTDRSLYLLIRSFSLRQGL